MDVLDAAKFLADLPKAELHLHLEGTVAPATLVALSKRHDKEPITLPEAEALYKYRDFEHFLEIWTFVCLRIQTPEDYAMIAGDMLQSLANQGVRHAEVFVAVGGMLIERPHLNAHSVFAALETARLDAEARYGISTLWIVDASRGLGVSHVKEVFDIAFDLRKKYPAVIGIGIGGNEAAGPCRLFKDLYREAKERGLRLTAHCGEATGPVNGPIEIRDAIDMGVERLGHAFCAQYDEALLEELKRRKTVLELNVTSNVRTNVCARVGAHPIKEYFDRGLVCTINSDDPAMFGSNILEEYTLVYQHFGFSLDDMRKFAENSFRSSFLPDENRARWIDLVRVYQ
ncbi:hypothetical protein GGI35DRAFT_458566 [Trichoderma velutinum]